VQGGVDISVLRPTLISLLAGPIAEHRFTNGHVVWTRNDLNTAKILLDTTNLSSEQRRNLSNECFAEARRIIDEFWGCIEVLAIRLIRRRYLDADEIRECILSVGRMGQRLLGVEVRTYKNPELRYRPMILTLAPSK
jgi:hypothetical protein